MVVPAPATTTRTVVVKFATRYGHAVHAYGANNGFAPQLLCHETLVDGWEFVVMEHLDLGSLKEVTLNGVSAAKIKSQVERIHRTLVTAGYVHGDLRANHVLWERVVLVDYMWSGKAGEAVCYPSFMSMAVAWPQGVQCGRPMHVAHDAYWFDDRLKKWS